MFYFLTKSKEYTVYLSYTEVTTSFKKIGLTQNSVQVAKLTMTVQYLQETNKSTILNRHHLMVPKPNQTNKQKTRLSKIKPQKKLPTLNSIHK